MWWVICAWSADGVDDRTCVWARLGLVGMQHGWRGTLCGHQFREVAEYLGRHIIMNAYIVGGGADGRLSALFA